MLFGILDYANNILAKDFGILDYANVSIRRANEDGRAIKILQTDNGKEFQNSAIKVWFEQHSITAQYCEKDDKKCLGVE